MQSTRTNNSRVAVITGGSRGIGRSIAAHLADGGYSLAIAFAADHREAQTAVAEVEAKGAHVLAASLDVADEQAVAALFDTTEERFGGIDVVVNAAGMTLLAPLVDFDLKQLDRMHRTNIRGTFVVNQQAAAAVDLAREAVAIALETDMLNDQGDAFADLGEVLALAGDPAGAAEAYARAL